jgi:DNA-binding NtrC family response regulator
MTSATIMPSIAGGVLVASPSTSLREQVRQSLHQDQGPIHEVNGGADALVKLESGHWQLLFLDRRLPDLDAEELIKIIRLRFPGIEVVLLDSDGDAPFSAKASGSNSWLNPQQLASSVPRQRSSAATLSRSAVSDEPISSAGEEPGPHLLSEDLPARAVAPLPGMIGDSEPMQRVYRLTRLVARHMTTVMVLGATGTGKELVARAIHQLSARAAKPLAVVNCAAIPEALLESELFGHVRGAFTGAVQGYAGRIHLAQGGTLFLDEVGELPLSLQAKLLRFLDQKEVQRLGSSEALKVDVRVVAATNANLGRCVEQGRFRSDLYYRLSAFPLELPTLAERAGDILRLADHFLREIATASRSRPAALEARAAGLLAAHSWPGNVRELQQVMERASILSEGSLQIRAEHLYFSTAHRGGMASSELTAAGTI